MKLVAASPVDAVTKTDGLSRFWLGYLRILFKYSVIKVTKKLFPTTAPQAWRGRKRQAYGHHLPSSIQGEWLAIDDQKNKILASLCLASYLVANWFQKLEKKHCTYHAEFISVLIGMWYGISVWFIYNKTKLFCKMLVFVPHT